jgi:hypothetical protein
MKLELSGKEFTLRCDMAALDRAKQLSGIELTKLDEDGDIVELSKLLFYFAESGAKFAGIPFDYELDAWLALIDISDLPKLSDAVSSVLGGAEKKS